MTRKVVDVAHILAIDDDPQILALEKTALERDGHQVEVCLSTHEANARSIRFADLILLDVMMPGEDGFAYCKRIRGEVDCPLLFVTARSEESDLVTGLGLGADDYIQKPFTVAELRARVNAHLRRETRVHTNALRVGDFCLDLAGKQILYKDEPIPFTKSEYIICAQLIESPGQTFSKEQLLEAVSGFDGKFDSSTVVEHMKNVRAKLKAVGVEPIETVWGIGYRWQKEKQ